jgi:hypothetical protein
LAEGLFAEGEGGAFLRGLAAFAGEVAGPLLTLGAIIIPTPAGRVSEGDVPGQPGLHYSFDEPAGVLRLYRDAEKGRETIADAQMRPDGVFVDRDTGVYIARFVSGKVVIDPASLPWAAWDVGAQRDADQPKLCPDPGEDRGHGSSERADAYQAQISRLNNPQRPLMPGEAVSLYNSQTGDRVVFDDCRESDGTMIEAKGPGFAHQLKYAYGDFSLVPGWVTQARSQVDAAGSRDIAWFFAEPEAAERAKKAFGNDDQLRKIEVFYVPAEQP